ncbi:MAG: hypothetical protein J6Y02_20280 [Pseudobutyrivibrio sp.]|nr:hypothetical protein [Pseudobutyrivibrio sp.]
MAISKLILNGVTQMDVTSNTNVASNMLSGVVGTKNDGTSVTGNILSKDNEDVSGMYTSASGYVVSIPAGYYQSDAGFVVPEGSASPASSISATGATVSTGTNTLTLSKTVSNTPQVSSGYVNSGTSGNSSVSLTASVNTRNSSSLSASGATVTAPAGYYASDATKTVASGTEGTPTATKGTVSNHSITVTPSVTNTAGYISGSTKTGTGVSVTASELASGNKSITGNGTNIDVVGYSTVSVSVSGGGNLCTLTNDGSSNNAYVKYNNTKYYTANDTFNFDGGDTLVLYLTYGTDNIARVNNSNIAGGVGQIVNNYEFTLPDCSIEISFTKSSGASYINISVPSIQITENGLYEVDEYGYADVSIMPSVTPIMGALRSDAVLVQRWTDDKLFVTDLSGTIPAYTTSSTSIRSSGALTYSGGGGSPVTDYSYYLVYRSLNTPVYNSDTIRAAKPIYDILCGVIEYVIFPANIMGPTGTTHSTYSSAVQYQHHRLVYYSGTTGSVTATTSNYGPYSSMTTSPSSQNTTTAEITISLPTIYLRGSSSYFGQTSWEEMTDLRMQYVFELYKAPISNLRGWSVGSLYEHTLDCAKSSTGTLT